ncbi:MAG: hypothetical protein QOJ02_2829 [Acidobacteriota bacterium]|jgi:hypothetical protein|nr:hypothetical protein [Acidobacteriota bacterium]
MDKEVRFPRSRIVRLKMYRGLFGQRADDEPLPPTEAGSWVVELIPASAAQKLEEATAKLKASRTRARTTQKEIARLRRETRRILDRIEARLP